MDNPLTILHNSVQVLQLSLAQDESVQGQLATVRRQLEQLQSLTGELRDTLQQPDHQSALELGPYLRDRLTSLKKQRPEFSQLRIDFRLDTSQGASNITPRYLDAICKPLLFWMCSRATAGTPETNANGTNLQEGILELTTRAGVNVDGRLFTRLCLRDYAFPLTRPALLGLFDDASAITPKQARMDTGLPASVSLLHIKDQLLAVGGSISVENCDAGGLKLTLLLPETKAY